jgi:putative transposase
MPRRLRQAAGGYAYHVLNRAVGRATIFKKAVDFEAFVRVLTEAQERTPMRILAFCVMSNHWHLVLWPKKDGELSEFMRWLTVTHTQRWHARFHTQGTGPLYQGRFKSFPIEEDVHLLKAMRYAERNPLRAGIVTSAIKWRWNSLGRTHWKLDGPVMTEPPLLGRG